MNRAIIYCRKSTDRDDKQQNSIESQITACMQTIETNNFTLVETFIESASAKKSGKRPFFQDMLSLCRKKKVDYIVVDEASRLSRNNTDSASILGLLEEGYIKGIYTTSQRYFGEQASELFMLLLNFGMAKFDNDTRARNVKARMITCAEKGRCLGKAPFGYKNVTILKDGQVHKRGVVIDPTFSKIVQHIFSMRGEQKMSLSDISDYCKREYSELGGRHRFTVQGIQKLLDNPFYIGMVRYAGKVYTGEHEAIIKVSLFKKVEELERGFYSHNKNNESPLQYLYKGIIRDGLGIPLTAEVKKGKYIYYKNQNLRSSCKISISERIIENTIIEELSKCIFPESFYTFCFKIAKEVLEEKDKENSSIEKEVSKELELLRDKEKRLLNGYLDGIIDGDIYKKSQSELIEKITIIEARKKELKNKKTDDLEKNITELFELLKNLSETYKSGNTEQKQYIHRKFQFELSVSNKKELTVGNNKLFDDLKTCSLDDGSATENRTPV